MVTFARIKTSTCGTNDNQRSGKLTVDLCGEKGVWCGEKEFGVGKRSLVRRKCWFALKSLCCAFFINLKQLT